MRTLRVPLVLIVVGLSSRAIAQPTFEAGKREDVKDVTKTTWTAKGEAGLVSTTGNSKTTTLTGAASAIRKDQDNKLELSVDGTFARSTTRTAADLNGNGVIDEGELSSATATSAENAKARLRYDRYLTGMNALYVAAIAGFDKPAGKDLAAGGQIGYSRGLYKDDQHEVLGEIGYDLTYLELTAGGTTTIHSARAFVGDKSKLSTATAVEASLEALFNLNSPMIGPRQPSAFEDTRLNGVVSVTTSLSSKLSLSASFTAKYDNVPAPLATIGGLPFAASYAPTADKLDTITKVSLILTFL
jgi:hypothetical protein